ncbi:fas apoptotic inhibitory molecule 3 [Seriola lalandi dorsalis]|uniref:fas apoptotic inhibitory molecule 3 n=1 Tax=Seriola lalandi dorsalis TaxID=1841481 RepID=UPI000C6FBAA8|nr:fas apoptotic inhibitory molecule 3 [Seriola lalandi dorsalis]
MKVCQILICCFFLSLQEGNTAQTSVYPGTEGGNVTVSCRYPALGTWKYFCKGEYGRRDILVGTVDDTAQRGRYSIRYVEEPRAAVLDVTITQLTKSDSGRYGCGLDRTELLYKAFEVIVVDEPPVESEYASVKEANPTYEEIREVERQSRSPPEGISSVYAYTKYTNPN